MPSLSMVFDVLAIDRASAVFDKVGASADRAGASVDAAATTTSNAGSRIAAGLGLATAAAVALSVKMAGDFQQNVTKLATTAGETQSNLAKVSKGMLDMSTQVGIGANDLAKGMYTVESAGFHGADALNVLKAAGQGSRQELADLGKTTDALTTILHDYNIPASQAADVMSKLVTAVSTGKTTLEDFTGSLHSVTPLAAALHVPLQDILGSLAAMTASGESADQATQNMADALRHLQSPTSVMTAELAQVGITSAQLSTDLGTKGLAGTMQEIEQAILQHIDPATQKVLLPAFNQSKIAASDLAQMIQSMPPGVAKLSQGLLDGTTNITDYTKAVKGMGGEAGASGLQFLSLYKSSDAFNAILKAGGPAAQVFTSALQKSVGDVAGLTVALQLTGEHAGTVNANIQKIAKSSADSSGNIKGWSEVQRNFDQQLAVSGASLEKMGIELGQKLLPALTSGLGYINRDVIPGVEHLGSAVGGAVHWFSELPGPVKDAALALAAIRVADMIGVFDRLSGSVGRFKQAMDVQEALRTMNVATGQAEGGISRLSLAASTAATKGLGVLKSAAGGLLSAFGGPWGLAIAGATLGITALMNAISSHDAEVKQATQDVQKWSEVVALGGGGTSAISAQKNLDALKQKIADVTAKINEYNAAAAGGNARGGIGSLISQQKELQSELDKGTQAWKDQLAGMTPLQTAQERLTLAQQDLNKAYKDNPPNSSAVTVAQENLAAAQAGVAGETERANRAAQTQIQQMQDQATKTMGLVDAKRQAQEASLALTQQVTDYNTQVANGTLKGDALKQATLGIVDAAEQAANAAGDAAAKQAAQNGATDTGAASQSAFMKSLQDFDSTLTGPAKKAMDDYITQLGGQQTQAQLTAGAINGIGVQVTGLPDSHLITINAPTADQEQKLQQLGYDVVHLPDHTVVVSADTNPAIGEIQDLLAYARQQSIQYRSDLPDLVPNVSGGGRMGHAATGGEIHGPGTGTSDTAGLWALSDGEFVVKAAQTAKFLPLLHAINNGTVGGMADGGYVGPSTVNIPVSIDEAQAKSVIAQMYQQAAAAMSPTGSGADRWRPLVDQVLQMLGISLSADSGVLNIIAHESGGNPNAINLWDSNAMAGHPSQGLMQTIPSTFYAYAGPFASRGILDPLANIYAGTNYALHNYGFGMLAGGGRKNAFGGYMGYDNGGWLMPGVTMAYNGTGKPERIRTADQEAALSSGGPMRIVGTLDLGNGLVGVIQGEIDNALGQLHDLNHAAAPH